MIQQLLPKKIKHEVDRENEDVVNVTIGNGGTIQLTNNGLMTTSIGGYIIIKCCGIFKNNGKIICDCRIDKLHQSYQLSPV